MDSKKKYLQSYNLAVIKKKRFCMYLEELEELKQYAENLKELCSCIDEVDKHINHLERFEINLRQTITKASAMCDNVTASINALLDEKEKAVLAYRYIECYTWAQIAEEMTYSVRMIHRIHKKALEHLEV